MQDNQLANNDVSIPKELDIDVVSKMILDMKDVSIVTEPTAFSIGGLKAIGINKVCIMDIPGLLLSHPAIERGIEFKFNRMIKQLDKKNIRENVYAANDTPFAKIVADEMADILKNSNNQPLTWVKQFGKDAMRFGDNYFVLIPNKAKNKILRWELQNPIFFSPNFVTNKNSSEGFYPLLALKSGMVVKYDIDPKTKKPKTFTQLVKDEGKNVITVSKTVLKPTGVPIPASKVVQLNFDRIGDDPFGIPIVHTLWRIMKDLIRLEGASTDSMVAFGVNKYIAKTQFRTKEKMKKFGQSLSEISKSSVTVLPEGVELDNIKPGSTEFDKVHVMLMKLIAMRLGITLLQLEGTGEGITKSTLDSIMKDVRADYFADELEIESAINEGFIKSCIVNYNLSGDKLKTFPFPKFSFFEVEEDKDDRANRELKQSLTDRNNAFVINLLMANGFVESASALVLKCFPSLNAKNEEVTNIKDIKIKEVEKSDKKINDTANPKTVTKVSQGL